MSYLHVKNKEFARLDEMVRLSAHAGSYFDAEAVRWVGSSSPLAVTVEVARRFLRLIRETKSGIAAVVRRENPDSCEVGPWPATFRVKGGLYRFEEKA